jgi:hypothetical protein
VFACVRFRIRSQPRPPSAERPAPHSGRHGRPLHAAALAYQLAAATNERGGRWCTHSSLPRPQGRYWRVARNHLGRAGWSGARRGARFLLGGPRTDQTSRRARASRLSRSRRRRGLAGDLRRRPRAALRLGLAGTPGRRRTPGLGGRLACELASVFADRHGTLSPSARCAAVQPVGRCGAGGKTDRTRPRDHPIADAMLRTSINAGVRSGPSEIGSGRCGPLLSPASTVSQTACAGTARPTSRTSVAARPEMTPPVGFTSRSFHQPRIMVSSILNRCRALTA